MTQNVPVNNTLFTRLRSPVLYNRLSIFI